MGRKPNKLDTAFNTYYINDTIGQGGSGIAYSVKDNNSNFFAIKCLKKECLTTEKLKRFKNEMEFCCNHDYPNIIKILDTGYFFDGTAKCPFYVMPLYKKTLRTLIDEGISYQNILSLFCQMLDGVEAAHLLQVWHRDLKPENILYDEENKVLKIADFGIAHFCEDIIATKIETNPFSKLANLRYSAPEQRTKGVKADQRADIFALGLILNEMFTKQVIQGTGYKTIASVSIDNAYLDEIVEQMVQNNPDARPSSIEKVKHILAMKKTNFINDQELDKKKKIVVNRNEPEEFDPILLEKVDYKDGMLIFSLNRIPEHGWIIKFSDPLGPYTSICNYGPARFEFKKNIPIAKVSFRNDYGVIPQKVVDKFKEYLEIANKGYQQLLNVKATEAKCDEEERLKKEISEAELKKEILTNLKI